MKKIKLKFISFSILSIFITSCEKEELGIAPDISNEKTKTTQNDKLNWDIRIINHRPGLDHRYFENYQEESTGIHWIGCHANNAGGCTADVDVSAANPGQTTLINNVINAIDNGGGTAVSDIFINNEVELNSIFGINYVSGIIESQYYIEHIAAGEAYSFLQFRQVVDESAIAQFPIKTI